MVPEPAMFTRMRPASYSAISPARAPCPSSRPIVSDASAKQPASAPATSASSTLSPAASIRNPSRSTRTVRATPGTAASRLSALFASSLGSPVTSTAVRTSERARDVDSSTGGSRRIFAMLSSFLAGHCHRVHRSRAHAALVDTGGDAQEELIDAAGDGPGQRHELGPTHLIEPKRGLALALRSLDEHGKRVFADPAGEARVDEPSDLEQHLALAGGEGHDQGARLAAESDGLSDLC